jgi:hypothetical protein
MGRGGLGHGTNSNPVLCFSRCPAIVKGLLLLAHRLRRVGVKIVDFFSADPKQRSELPSEIRPTIVDLTSDLGHNS